MAGTIFANPIGGGVDAFSSQAATAAMTVNFVPLAPAWISKATASFTPVLGYPAADASGDTVASVFGSAFSDPDPTIHPGVAIIGLTGTTSGAWQFNTGNGWTNFPSSVGASSNGTALFLSGSDLIRFLPDKLFSGTVALTVRAWDGTTNTDGTTAPAEYTQNLRHDAPQQLNPGGELPGQHRTGPGCTSRGLNSASMSAFRNREKYKR